MSRRHKRHGPGGHGPGDHEGHEVFDPHTPKPPGEVATPPPPTPGEDVDLRAIVRFGLGLLVVTIGASLLVFALMRQLGRRAEAREPQAPAPPGMPRSVIREYGQEVAEPDGGVRLQRRPFADLETQRARDEELLTKYGWVDRPSETVRIPIELAKRLVVQRGLPARGQEPTAADTVSATATPTPSPQPTAATPRPTRRPSPRPTAETTAEPTATPEGGA
jgi:hypothetical protein